MVDTRPSLAEAPAAVPVKRDFSSGNYWNDRYASRVCVYDWFFDYSALRGLFSKYLPHSLPCLHLGCGNSDIQNGMAADGFVKVTNVDISGVVIQQLEVAHKKEKEKQKQAPSGPEDQDGPKCTVSGELEYITGDCRDMSGLASKSFGSCLDKGTLDALACSSSGSMDVSQYIAEVDRLLVPGGTFMLISLGGPEARKKSLSAPPLNDWASKLVLLPKPSDLLKSEAALKGVEVSSTNTNDRGDDIELLGPWTWLEAEEQMKDLTTKHYFFCYILTKPVVGDISPSEVAESKAETVPTSQSAEVADAVPI